MSFVAGACSEQPVRGQSTKAPAEVRSLREFGAVGDGRTDDSKAIVTALVGSGGRCIDGEGRTYRVVGSLRVSTDLCLQNLTLLQSAQPLDTSAYIHGTCPEIEDPAMAMDCGDLELSPAQLATIREAQSIRTLFVRPQSGAERISVVLDRVKIDRGRFPQAGSRTDSAGIWLDGADSVELSGVEITGNGKGFGLIITRSRNVNIRDLWIHDLVWAPDRGDLPLNRAAVARTGWNAATVRELREGGQGVQKSKFYGVRVQEQLTCAFLADVQHVRIDNIRIERCHARFAEGDLPWQADGLTIGQSSRDILVRGGSIDSTWEGIDVVGGGAGTDNFRLENLRISNSFAHGIKLGYSVRDATISNSEIRNSGLSGIALHGPVRSAVVRRVHISEVGVVETRSGILMPWPFDSRAGIRVDRGEGGSPSGISVEDVTVANPRHPSAYVHGIRDETQGVRAIGVRIEGARAN